MTTTQKPLKRFKRHLQDYQPQLKKALIMTLDQIHNGIANSAEAQQHKNGCR